MSRLTQTRRRALDGMMKEALFEATVAVLSAHGVEGMTMERVAAAAGIAKGSVYNYFSSKQELLEFVYTKTIDPLIQDLIETVATEQPAIAKLAKHLGVMLEHCAKHAKVFQLLFQDDSAQGLLLSSQRHVREAVSRRLACIMSQGIAEGVFRPLDPLVLANMYLALCRAMFDTPPGPPALERPEQRAAIHGLLMDMFLQGVATKKGCAGQGGGETGEQR